MGPFNNLVAIGTFAVAIVGIRSRKLRTQTIVAGIYFVLFMIAIFEYTPVLVVA